MRPLGVRSKAVKHNNLSLIRHFGNPNETLLPFLGNYLPVVDRVSEDMAAKIRYLWQDTVEELALAEEVTEDVVSRAWVLLETEKKPLPDALKKFFAEKAEKQIQQALEQAQKEHKVIVPTVPKKAYDKFLDDVDMDTTEPIQAKRVSTESPELDLDMEHDTFDTFKSVFNAWPYIGVFDHKDHGKILALGQLNGTNKHEQMVYKGCKFNDDSFGKIGAISEYERKGMKDSTFKIRILKIRPGVVKFWVNVDDETRPKGQRDLEHLYRYFEVTLNLPWPQREVAGIREIDSMVYTALKNQVHAA